MTGRVLERLAGVVVAVPEPAATAAFLRDGLGFGLREREDAIDVLCEGDYAQPHPQAAITLVGGSELALRALRFEPSPGADPEAAVRAAGAEAVDRSADGTLRFTDPNGVPVTVGADLPPAGELPPSGLRPRRLGHANLKVADLGAGVRFWVRGLGMLLSEQIGDDLAFLRYGAEHHNLGLRIAPVTSLHHLGFEIPGWEAYRPILDHLADAGHQVEFGPGRHGVGRNMFTYLRDPGSGLRIELFCDMARVEHQDDPEQPLIRWRAEDRMSRTLNRWGSAPPPPSFME